MSESAHEIRTFRDEDEPAIRELFRLVFGGERSPAHWRWKFADTPYPDRCISLALGKPDGELAGHYAVVPVRMNLLGRPILGCQSLDTMVHPDAQGRGLFEQTAAHCYRGLPERGISLVFGLPNRNSYPGFMRKLAWRRIGFLQSYSLRLGVNGPLERLLHSRPLARAGDALYRLALRARLWLDAQVLRRRIRGAPRFRVVERAPEGCDALWDELRSYEVLSLWKDREYLQWRYDRHPDRRFEYALLESNGELAALAVVETSHPVEVRICELLVQGRDVQLGALLVREIARRHQGRGRQNLVFRGLDAGFFDAVFAGFHRETDFGLVFGARSLGDPTLDELLPVRDNWTVVCGDTDLV